MAPIVWTAVCLCVFVPRGKSMRTRMQFGFMVLLTALFTLNRHRFISGLLGLSLVLTAATFGTIQGNPPAAGVTVLSWFS
jgi:hypothetical protein